MNKFWNWARNSDESRTLYLDGAIAEESWFDDDITPAAFKAELLSGDGDITVWINSPGGDCVAASQIYSMLMDYKGNVTVKIDGIAASAASVIAMAGTEVLMSPTSLLMIHNPLTVAIGNSEEMQKAIIVITDGENFEDDAVGATKLAAEHGIQVDVIGLGSAKGALIPTGRDGQFMRDDSGNPVTTRLNEEMAQEIARAGNGIYVQGASSSALSDLETHLDQLAKSQIQKVSYAASAEQFPVFGWLALLLVIIDIIIPDRKIGWLKQYTFFGQKPLTPNKDNKR